MSGHRVDSIRMVGNTTLRVKVKAAEHAAARAERERRQQLGEMAHRLRRPGQPLHEAVEAVQIGVAERQAGIGLWSEQQRERAIEEIVSPSALVRRVERDWPHQAEAVRRIAAELGSGQADAWHQVIVAGIRALQDELGQVSEG